MNSSLLLLTLLFFILSFTGNADAQPYRLDTLARAPAAQYPVCIAFPPRGDGSFFFTEKNSGRVRFFAGTLRPIPLLTVPVETEGPQGLLGIAFHPSYPDTPFVFVYYVRAQDRLGLVERYRDSAGVGIDPTPIALIPRRDAATDNNGGRLRFGPDGKLYVAIGDHRTHPESAQDTSSRHIPWGKILRINTDGSYPPDNPSPLKPFWALGLRNCQGLAFDEETGDLYCTDGGTTGANAVLRVKKGDNFGWPNSDVDATRRYARPLYKFPPENAPDLTGIVVYRGDAFPRLRGKLLFTGNANPTLWTATLTGDGDSLVVERFMNFPTGFADLQVGPDGCLYLVNGPYLSNRILRIAPVAPRFTSTPETDAVQNVRYSYTPTFGGTLPEVTLLTGPDGMMFDQETGTVHWTPTNAQAMEGTRAFTLQARNGAGSVAQQCTVHILNVNDPPTSFSLTSPPAGAAISFFARDPEITLRWSTSVDPDGDSIHYTVAVDTTLSIAGNGMRVYEAGTADSIRIQLPRVSQTYFWQVTASDGRYVTQAAPEPAAFSIAVTTPVPLPVRVIREPSPPPRETVLPFQSNPSMSVSYALARAGHVRIAVFNILGQEIMRVLDATQQEGSYTVDFSRLNLPNGMYFYRLQAPGIFETKKVVLSR